MQLRAWQQCTKVIKVHRFASKGLESSIASHGLESSPPSSEFTTMVVEYKSLVRTLWQLGLLHRTTTDSHLSSARSIFAKCINCNGIWHFIIQSPSLPFMKLKIYYIYLALIYKAHFWHKYSNPSDNGIVVAREKSCYESLLQKFLYHTIQGPVKSVELHAQLACTSEPHSFPNFDTFQSVKIKTVKI